MELCPICDGSCTLLDTVDFNKNCEELRGKFLPKSGIPVQYHACGDCGFCFAPEIAKWTDQQFRERIYNPGYAEVDPDYSDLRPRAQAHMLRDKFGARALGLRHLDYGGGNGLLSRLLVEAGWDSTAYDPFADPGTQLADLGRFDVVTAFEVFEHVPDAPALMDRIASLLKDDGMVVFSTMLSDGNIAPGEPLTWWYAAPRNGHISLYSRVSLAFLAGTESFSFGSYSPGLHAFWRGSPRWAEGLLPDA
jgi:SAM-dependent methyltransferase